jgi:hypothetical protein
MADILLIVFLLVVTGSVMVIYNRAEQAARAKLGEAVEIQLYRRWGVVFQRLFLALAVLFPVAVAAMAVIRHSGFDALFASFMRSFWMLSVVYGLRRSSVLLIGERGVFTAGLDMTLWKDILRIDWDRDIGQQQWGVTLVVRKKRGEEKRRLYIHREKKGEVEGAIERFHPQQQEAEAVGA